MNAATVHRFAPQHHHPSTRSRTGVCAWGQTAYGTCERTAEFSAYDPEGTNVYAVCEDHLAGYVRWATTP